MPRAQNGNPLIVYMNVSVLAFPSIETMKLSFTSDFFLNLRWYDLRVSLQDLNVVTTLNILSTSDKSEIWTPKLAFTNALGPFETEVDSLTTGVLIREGQALDEDITLETEGNTNSQKISDKEMGILETKTYLKSAATLFKEQRNDI